MTPVELTLAILLGIVTLIGAVLGMLNRRRKDLDDLERQHNQELFALAETRREVIADLRAEMQELEQRHKEEMARLTAEIAELRGQYNAMRNFQVQTVVDEVTKGVLQGLGAL